MARAKPATLDAVLITRRGEASPARAPGRSTTAMPRGTNGTVAVTGGLDEERYQTLVGYGARFTPQKTDQEILVEALDAYLERVEE